MNHIYKSFLTTEEKIIPFNPMRANYGFSSVDGKDLERITALLQVDELKNLYIKDLPSSVPFVVFLLRIPRSDEVEFIDPNLSEADLKNQNLKVEDVQTAPPGISSVTFTIDANEQYYVYILSSEYMDGYIQKGNLTEATLISESVDYGERYIFSVDSDEKIFVNGISFEESNLNGNGNPNVWYDFQGNYDNQYLVWEDPQPWLTYAQNRPQGNQSWLVYMRNYLAEHQANVFKCYDLEGFNGKELYESTVLSRLNTGQINMTDIVRGNFGRDNNYRTTSKWKEWEDYFLDIDVANSYYLSARYNDNDDLAEYQIDGDPVPQFKSKPTHADIISSMAIFYVFVCLAYNKRSSGRFFWSDFRSPSSATVSSKFDTLASAVNNEISQVTELQLETTHPVIGTEAATVLERLRAYSSSLDRTGGRQIIDYMVNKLNEWDQIYSLSVPRSTFFFSTTYNSDEQFNNAFTGSTGCLQRGPSEHFLSTYYKRVTKSLIEVDQRIRDLGDGVVIPAPEDERDTPELAHEAVLQNIRFLRGVLDAFVKDSWTESTNFSSFILRKIEDLRNELLTLTARANTLFGITDARVDRNTIEVVWKKLGTEVWNNLTVGVTDQGYGVKAINVSEIREPGRYLVLIRPKGKDIRITDIVGEALITTPDLDDYRTINYFFGWNIEFTQPGSTQIPIGEQRMIVGSTFKVGATELLVSPNIFGLQDFSSDVYAYVWPNTFMPILVDLEITEHNVQTLAYAEYGHREFNTDTGVLTIYDFNGRPFRKFTVGERSIAAENFNTIEFKDPIE